MRALQASEVAGLRATQASSFNDLCNITSNVLSQDAYGDEVLTPTTLSNIVCGITLVSASDSRTPLVGRTAIDYSAIIRLPVTTVIGLNATITIVDKQDTSVGNTFKVIGLPEIGPTAMNVYVKEITP